MVYRCIFGALLGAVAAGLLQLIWGDDHARITGALMAAVIFGAPLGALWGAFKWNPGFIWGGVVGVVLGLVVGSAGSTAGALVCGVVGAFMGAYFVEKHEVRKREMLRVEKRETKNQEETEGDVHN